MTKRLVRNKQGGGGGDLKLSDENDLTLPSDGNEIS